MKWLESFEMNAQKLRSGWPGVGPWRAGEAPVRVEDPPFVPLDLSPLPEETRSDHPAVTAPESEGPAATLAELGLPAELAHDFEVAFRALGATAEGQVIGYRFRTLDGVSHPLRLAEPA